MHGQEILLTIPNLRIAYFKQKQSKIVIKKIIYIADTEYHLIVHVRWVFDNGFARDVIVFGVDNSSSSHSDSHKNNFLILVEGYSYGINGTFGSPEK